MLKTDKVFFNCLCINISAYILSNTLRNILSCSLFHFNTCFFIISIMFTSFDLGWQSFVADHLFITSEMLFYSLTDTAVSPHALCDLFCNWKRCSCCNTSCTRSVIPNFTYTTIRCFLGLFSVDWM